MPGAPQLITQTIPLTEVLIGVISNVENPDGLTSVLFPPITGPPYPTGYSDPVAGQAANRELFKTRYFRATRDSNGEVAVSGIDLDGSAKVGKTQPDAPQFGEGLFDRPVVMSITLAAGELVAD